VIAGCVITSSLVARRSRSFVDCLAGAIMCDGSNSFLPALVVFALIASVLISWFYSGPGVALDLGSRSLLVISNNNLYQASADCLVEYAELNLFARSYMVARCGRVISLIVSILDLALRIWAAKSQWRNSTFGVGMLTAGSLIRFIVRYRVNNLRRTF